MPWDGVGQRRATRNDITKRPITTGMPRSSRFKAVDEEGTEYTIWAHTLDEAAIHATERGWVIVRETTNEIEVTTHPPAKDRSTPF